MFNIDEDAYNVLHVYLEKLQLHFSSIEEGSEIVKDIESRIAEIFNMKINESKQVINIADVNDVIAILGEVEDITGENDNEKDEATSEGQKKQKKLYRDSENKILGGVCSGLSEYTGISTTTWRIIFLVFIFVGQVSIIAYIILWLAVPEAKTTAQKIEMKGGKINLSSIEKTVKQEFDELKKNFRKVDSNKFSNIFNNIGQALLTVLKVFAQVFSKVIGVLFLIVGASILVLTVIGLLSVSKDNVVFSNDFLSMVWLPRVLEYFTNSGTALFLSICIFIVFIIPVFAIIAWGVMLLFEVKGNKYLSMSTFAVWVLAIILSVGISINIGSSYKSIEQKTITETIPCDSLKTYNFTISPGSENIKLTSEEDIEDLNDFNLRINEHFIIADGKKIKSLVNIEFVPGDKEIAEMEIKYYARGINNFEAKDNLKLVSYNYNITDSLVSLDPFYFINSNKWKAQNTRVSIHIPIGSKLIINKSLQCFIDIDDISGKLEEEDLVGKTLLVTKEGFVIM
jgi:phage shock protein PspC (stress-responsive transcriptional regulator)